MKVSSDRSLIHQTVAVCAMLIAVCSPSYGQQPKEVHRVGFLMLGSPPPRSAPPNENLKAFQEGLRQFGYGVGENVIIERRYAKGRSERLPELTEELVRLKVDAIVAASTPSIRSAIRTTTKIPIVILSSAEDPVIEGFIESLARPGGNVTGVSGLGFELSGKLLEVLTEAVPGRTPIGVLSHPVNRAKSLPATKSAASALKIKLQIVEVDNRNDFRKAFSSLLKEHAGALLVLPAILFARNENQIADLAIESRLPAIFHQRRFAEVGGLMTYGPTPPELWRRMGAIVGKILNGSKPADLPVEQPTRFEFVINLRTANQIGLTIPPNVLARADRVIR